MNSNEKKDLQLVKVYIRERPWTKDETELNRPCTVQAIQAKQITLKSGAVEKNYTFDCVFGKTSEQEEVYNVAVAPLIDFVLSGYTCTVFAYGQTGTGKTYTMIGQDMALNLDFANDPSVGMVPRAAIDLFKELAKLNVEYAMRVSFVEIYNEEVRDLLISDSVPLKVFDDPVNKGSTCIKDLTEVAVRNIGELYDFLNKGASERQISSTNLNRRSSRSHTIFTIVLNTKEVTPFGEELIKTGKLHLIDLAGSENIGRSGATEMRAREAGSINKSLLTLGKVIKALALKMQHIPYRESKLTRILQDSLGGKSKTCMIATFASTLEAFDETISTLDYAHMARSVANCPTVNINRNQTQVLTDSHNEIAKLRQDLSALRAGDGFYISNATYEEMTLDAKTKRERVSHLLQEVKTLEERIAHMEQQRDELNHCFEQTSSVVGTVKQKLATAEVQHKRTSYGVQYLNGRIVQLEEKSTKLFETCETSTRHEDIYYTKYQNQCNLAINNANVAKNIYVTSANCLNEVQNTSNNVKYQQHLDDAFNRVNVIKENQQQNLEQLDGILADMQESSENFNFTADDLFGNKKYSQEKLLNRLTSLNGSSSEACLQSLQAARNSIGEVGGHVLEKKISIEEQTTECTNLVNKKFEELQEDKTKFCSLSDNLHGHLENEHHRIQQRLHQINKTKELHEQLLQVYSQENKDILSELEAIEVMENIVNSIRSGQAKHVQKLLDVKEALIQTNQCVELLNPVSSLFQSAIATIEKNNAECESKIVSCQSQALEDYSHFVEAATEELDGYIKAIKTKLNSWTDQMATINENLKSTVEKNVEEIDRDLEHIKFVENASHNDFVQFIKKLYEDLKNIENDLKTTVHAGDTPVKRVYQYPMDKEETELTEDMLQEAMKIMVDSPSHH